MGDHDDSIFEVDQEFLEPADGVEIQMVRRLVQQQDVRISEQRPRQQDLDLQGTVQVLHQRIVVIRLHAKAVQEVRGITLRIPAVHVGKFRLQLCGFNAVLGGEVLLCVEQFLLLHDVV